MNKKMSPIPLRAVKLSDRFWCERQSIVRNSVIPYQWEALNDRVPGVDPSHTIENLRIAAGESEGEYHGMVFQDSDLAKWLEAVGYALALERDEKLETMADEVIDLVRRAQGDDGYLNTYFTVAKPGQRWTNLRDDHELYCAGHLIEAAVAYYEATGKRVLLDVVCRLLDHISTVLGTGAGQKRGYPGHPEIELALMRLYAVTNDRKHLELCRYFIDERGRQPNFFEHEAKERGDSRPVSMDYFQAHAPVREQTDIRGHAVRAVYLYSGAADLAAETGDAELLDACRRLWENAIQKRMYVTGGIGSSHHLESFTIDYDLPNDRAYAETCAAIGLVFWAHRMLQIDGESQYADVMERAIYNGILSGISLDGTKYFYVNPLEVWPAAAEHRDDLKSVTTTRQGWFGCACCPPNIARFLQSFGRYMYSVNEDKKEVHVHLFAGSEAVVDIGGQTVRFVQETDYPWDESVRISVHPENGAAEFTLCLRLPEWCREPGVSVKDDGIGLEGITQKGYAKLTRTWQDGDSVELVLPMKVEFVRAHPELRENAGRVALQRGPLVYCLEEADNGANLSEICVAEEGGFSATFEPDLLGGVTVLAGSAERVGVPGGNLYTTEAPKRKPVEIKAVPYFAWCNRKPGEMIVWIRESY
jgi:uncharacterized protein